MKSNLMKNLKILSQTIWRQAMVLAKKILEYGDSAALNRNPERTKPKGLSLLMS